MRRRPRRPPASAAAGAAAAAASDAASPAPTLPVRGPRYRFRPAASEVVLVDDGDDPVAVLELLSPRAAAASLARAQSGEGGGGEIGMGGGEDEDEGDASGEQGLVGKVTAMRGSRTDAGNSRDPALPPAKGEANGGAKFLHHDAAGLGSELTMTIPAPSAAAPVRPASGDQGVDNPDRTPPLSKDVDMLLRPPHEEPLGARDLDARPAASGAADNAASDLRLGSSDGESTESDLEPPTFASASLAQRRQPSVSSETRSGQLLPNGNASDRPPSRIAENGPEHGRGSPMEGLEYAANAATLAISNRDRSAIDGGSGNAPLANGLNPHVQAGRDGLRYVPSRSDGAGTYDAPAGAAGSTQGPASNGSEAAGVAGRKLTSFAADAPLGGPGSEIGITAAGSTPENLREGAAQQGPAEKGSAIQTDALLIEPGQIDPTLLASDLECQTPTVREDDTCTDEELPYSKRQALRREEVRRREIMYEMAADVHFNIRKELLQSLLIYPPYVVERLDSPSVHRPSPTLDVGLRRPVASSRRVEQILRFRTKHGLAPQPPPVQPLLPSLADLAASAKATATAVNDSAERINGFSPNRLAAIRRFRNKYKSRFGRVETSFTPALQSFVIWAHDGRQTPCTCGNGVCALAIAPKEGTTATPEVDERLRSFGELLDISQDEVAWETVSEPGKDE